MEPADEKGIRYTTRDLLIFIGEDPYREGLKDTPARVARFWKEFIDYDPGTLDVTFEAVSTDDMAILKGIKVFSLCEHHLLPIEMDVSIGYISEDARVLGLSKLARVAEKYAHRLQLQERYTSQVADEIMELANTMSVAVVVEGIHFCMRMRGVRCSGKMVTSAMHGKFRTHDRVRAEFFKLTERS